MATPKPRPAGLDSSWVPGIIRGMSRFNVWLYRGSGGLIGNRWYVGSAFRKGGVPVCLLTTTGRKSGKARVAPLLYLEDGDNVVVVGSQGGLPKHPQWLLNLRADPRCSVQIGRKLSERRARIADGEERERLWERLVELYEDFDSYQSWTERRIEVVVLEPLGNGAQA